MFAFWVALDSSPMVTIRSSGALRTARQVLAGQNAFQAWTLLQVTKTKIHDRRRVKDSAFGRFERTSTLELE